MSIQSDRPVRSVAGGVPRRTLVLGGVAAALILVLIAREVGMLSLGGGDGGGADGRSRDVERAELVERIGELSRFANAAEPIRRTYRANAFDYAREMSRVRTLILDRGRDPAAAAVQAVREVVRAGPVADAAVDAGTPQDRGGGVHQVLVSVDFTTPSDRHADRVVRELGDPARGSVWGELALTADAQATRVSVSGQLRTLVIESAE